MLIHMYSKGGRPISVMLFCQGVLVSALANLTKMHRNSAPKVISGQ